MGAHFEQLKSELNQRKIELIEVDIDTAMTFASIAQGAGDDKQKAGRNRKNARKGYDAVTYFLRGASVSKAERIMIQKRIAQLKEILVGLGEQFAD
jgi:hypothetical protein